MSKEAYPDHVWEAARSLRNAVVWESNSATEIIAKALHAAEQRGEGRMLDEYEVRVQMHHMAEELAGELLVSLRELVATVDTAYPNNAWTIGAHNALHAASEHEGTSP